MAKQKALCMICRKTTTQGYGPDGHPCHKACWRKFKAEEAKKREKLW